MKSKKTREHVKHTFTEEERRLIADEMAAQDIREQNDVEDDKKSVVSDFKSRLDVLSGKVKNSANKLNSGWEMRFMDCEKQPDYDKKLWQFYSCETGEHIKSEAMTESDMQMQLEEEILVVVGNKIISK